ncbi:MAG: hypothetical protein ACI351_01400 [Candidatus Avelusimicrobium sp.]|uniref:hypothetical protein n=1 Tax=Candidatus Avelusimicrobium sp. TaxID=3048833 RepID=UPI003F129C9E
MKKICTLLAVAVCLCACGSTLKTAVKNGAIAPAFNDTLLTGDYLWVRGFGAANPNHKTDSQRRIMSREAAIAHAYQRASEVLYGANLEANVQVVDAVSAGSTIESATNGVISQMELVSTEYMEDGGCTVIMRLNRERLKKAGLDPEDK